MPDRYLFMLSVAEPAKPDTQIFPAGPKKCIYDPNNANLCKRLEIQLGPVSCKENYSQKTDRSSPFRQSIDGNGRSNWRP